ncbi:C39 family peptidase [Dehalobacterium formicoaceticum]|uniref:C39 family peptidase n=1 Tax=Dehalobacterium formicoaceticum TaxID=51515 RepID=UPI0031F6835E
MAIDPATAKALATITSKVVTDSEARKKLLLIILAPTIGLLLLIAMILQILTMPFAMLGGAFAGDELAVVQGIRADADYTQLIDENDENYQESYGQSYEGLILTHGSTEVVYYNQLDSRWADIMYGTSGTIGQSGCGPTALSIIVSTLIGTHCDPVEMSEWSVAHGYRCEGNGSYHSIIPDGARAFGLKVEGATSKDAAKIAEALADGKLVGVIMSKGHFTSSGHFIVLRGITETGKILIADPASKRKSEQEWDFDIILNESRKGAGAGGPFWIISR